MLSAVRQRGKPTPQKRNEKNTAGQQGMTVVAGFWWVHDTLDTWRATFAQAARAWVQRIDNL